MQPGDIIADRFLVRREAGHGGMGVVYQADDRLSGRTIALKVIDADDASLSERFGREGQVLATLRHPGIVAYIAHGSTPSGEKWLAMEWLDGDDLSRRLTRSRLTLFEAVSLSRRVADALGAAHHKGVVHRDVKPSNLFLPHGRIDEVKLLDFGIARIRTAAAGLTLVGAPIGTPAYMSPEQARGEEDVDARSDVFSLGVVLHQCVIGKRPFQAQDPLALIAKIVLEDAPRLRDLRPDVPADLDELVGRMLAKDVDQRPADGAAVAAELAAIRTDGERSDLPVVGSLGAREQVLTAVVLAAGGRDRLDAVRAAVAATGARVEPMLDGSLIAALSGSGAATDLGARGARAALAMHHLLGADVPIAVVTGRAVLAGPVPVGEVIDRAAALVRGIAIDTTGIYVATPAPRVDGVRLDDVTAGLLDARFQVDDADGGLVLRGEREALEGSRTVNGKKTPCVARDAELAALDAAYEAAIDGPGARAVLITAAAGVGKSRLRHEWLARLQARGEEPLVLLGRADPMSAGAPFGVLADAIRRWAAVHDGDTAEVRHATLRERVGKHLSKGDAVRVAEFLGEVIGAPAPEPSVPLQTARGDGLLMGDQIRRALQDWWAAEARERALIVILEDLHWGDRPTIAAVDAALRHLRESPVLVVATARPEVHELFPGLWAERAVQELRLGELGRRACERLAKAVLGDRIAPELLARIVERSSGNAFYLEELLRAAADGADTLPETVLAMVQARLERLEPAARRVLRAASVFGETFWAGGVKSLLGDDHGEVGPWLEVLVEREVIVRRGEGRFRGEDDLGFRHALVRDAAYSALTTEDKVLGHRIAGRWLEGVGDRDAVRLAEHAERGEEPSRALAWWRRAAEQAMSGHDFAAVLVHIGHAVASGAAGEDLGALRVLQAEAHGWRGEFAEAERAATDAMRWLMPGDERWFAALGEAAAANGVMGRLDQLVKLHDALAGARRGPPSVPEALASTRLAEPLLIGGRSDLADGLLQRVAPLAMTLGRTQPGVAGRIWSALALRERIRGDVAANLSLATRAVASFEAAGDLRNGCVRHERVGYAKLELGEFEASERILREALASAERLGLANVAATARHNLGLTLARLGRTDEARAIESAAADAFRASGNRRMEGASLEYLALILLQAGDSAEAEKAARAALAVARKEPVLPLNAAESHAILGAALLAGGRAVEALAEAEAGARLLDSLGGIDDGEAIIRLVRAEALHANGRLDEAIAAIRAAKARLDERAGRIADPQVRASFLAVPENQRTVELAREWGDPRA
jgi:tetratricopeptide (TPR) repeat protein